MTGLQIALLVAVLVLLAIGLTLRRRAGAPVPGAKPARERQERIDTILGWPPQATRLLSPTERRAFALLTRALPGHMVLAQVPISRFVTVSKRNSYADWLRRVGYQCVDLVVCDQASEVVAVIELQPPQPTDRARKRLDRIARTLKAAELPLHVWQEAALPPLDRIRAALLPADTGEPGAATPAVPTLAFDDPPTTGPDDGRGLPEPRATTWFDEMESEKGPLGKR